MNAHSIIETPALTDDFSERSWPLRLDAHRGKPTQLACLESILRDAEKADDTEYARAAQYAIDSSDLSDLDWLDERENAPCEPERRPEFDPAWVHPDNPCQSGGWR